MSDRDTLGRFRPGISGNPAGRPKKPVPLLDDRARTLDNVFQMLGGEAWLLKFAQEHPKEFVRHWFNGHLPAELADEVANAPFDEFLQLIADVPQETRDLMAERGFRMIEGDWKDVEQVKGGG